MRNSILSFEHNIMRNVILTIMHQMKSQLIQLGRTNNYYIQISSECFFSRGIQTETRGKSWHTSLAFCIHHLSQ